MAAGARAEAAAKGERTIRVAALEEVPPGEAVGVRADGHEIVLCNLDGEIYALQGMCTHQDLPLDGGEIDDGVLTCEWHGAEFDVASGAARGLPASRPLHTYDAEVRDGEIHVTIRPRAACR